MKDRQKLIRYLTNALQLSYVEFGSGVVGKPFFTLTWGGLSHNNPQNARPIYRIWLCAAHADRVDPDKEITRYAYPMFDAIEAYEAARPIGTMSAGQVLGMSPKLQVWASYIDVVVEPEGR